MQRVQRPRPAAASAAPAAIRRAAAVAVSETLEGRRLLSTVTETDIDNDGHLDLIISGTGGRDNVYVFLDQEFSNSVLIVDDEDGDFLPDAGELSLHQFPETIDIDTEGGHDLVAVFLITDIAGPLFHVDPVVTEDGAEPRGNGLLPHGAISIYTSLGSGDDEFLLFSPAFGLPTNVPNALGTRGLPPIPDLDGGDIIGGADFVCEVDGDDGEDEVTFDLTHTSIECSEVFLHAYTGDDDDEVNLKLPDFDANINGTDLRGGMKRFEEAITGCFFEEEIDKDVEGKFPPLIYVPSNVQISIDLGRHGRNTLNMTSNTVIEGSNVHVDVDGGSDRDTINDSQSLAVFSAFPFSSADAERGLFPERLESRYDLQVDMGAGDDRYTADLDFRRGVAAAAERFIEVDFDGEVVFNIRGDSGNDQVIVRDAFADEPPAPQVRGPVNGNPAFVAGLLEFNLWGGENNDNVQLDLDPGAFILLRSGVFRANVSGDGGDDFVRIDVVFFPRGGAPTVRGPIVDDSVIDLTLRGGSGNDQLGFMFQIEGTFARSRTFVSPFSAGFLGPRTYALLDGGSGIDRWDTEGNGLIIKRTAEIEDDTIEDPFLLPVVATGIVPTPQPVTLPASSRRVSRLS